MADSKVKVLKQVPLFADLSARELAFVASRTDEVSVPAGKELTRQGRPSHSFYVILEGTAEVTIDGERRAILGNGDFFGEISMLDRGEGTATVTTTAPTRLMVMSHVQFRDVVKTSDAILVKVQTAMGRRLRADLSIAESRKQAR